MRTDLRYKAECGCVVVLHVNVMRKNGKETYFPWTISSAARMHLEPCDPHYQTLQAQQ